MFVSWDDDIPNIWKVIKAMFQTTNQWSVQYWRTVDESSDLSKAFLLSCDWWDYVGFNWWVEILSIWTWGCFGPVKIYCRSNIPKLQRSENGPSRWLWVWFDMPDLEPNKQHQKPKLIGTCYLVGDTDVLPGIGEDTSILQITNTSLLFLFKCYQYKMYKL